MMRLAIIVALLAPPVTAQDLTIATGGHYPPYIFNPGTTEATGLDKALVDELCDRGGYSCTWVDLPMGDIFQALARGDVDVVTGGFGYSAARDDIVDFTCPYVTSGDDTGDLMALSDDIDLNTARIGVLDQSLYQSAMAQAGRSTKAYPTEEAALTALTGGEIDVVFGSHNARLLAGDSITIIGTYPTFSGGSALAIAETAPNLRADLDALLAEVSADGTLSRLHVQWLGSDQGDVIARCNDINALT